MLGLVPCRAAIVAATVVVSLGARVERAAACSASWCERALALPVTETLPADAGGVFVYPGSRYDWSFDDYALELRLIEPGKSPVVLAVTWSDPPTVGQRFVAARIADALPVGATLELHGRDACADSEVADSELIQSWTIVPPLGGEIALGAIPYGYSEWGTVRVPKSASCNEDVETSVADISLVRDSSADAWEPMFRYETLVDGTPYYLPTSIAWFGGPIEQPASPGGSPYGRGRDRVYARCGDMTYGLEPGDHTIAMRALLPDGRTFTTNELTVMFSCDPALNSTAAECGCVCGVAPGAHADSISTLRGASAWAIAFAAIAIRRALRRRP